jgi:hypothetical protein
MVALLFSALVATMPFGTVQAATMWSQTYGGPRYDRAYSLVETADGGYAIAGYTCSYGAGVADVWLVKTNEFGVVPEASWVVLPLLMLATLSILVSKVANKKKLLRLAW